MYPNIKYSDLFGHDLLPYVWVSRLSALGRHKCFNEEHIFSDLSLNVLKNPSNRKLWVFVMERRCRSVHPFSPFQLSRPSGRSQSRSKAKR
jgi:hypothetical protein